MLPDPSPLAPLARSRTRCFGAILRFAWEGQDNEPDTYERCDAWPVALPPIRCRHTAQNDARDREPQVSGVTQDPPARNVTHSRLPSCAAHNFGEPVVGRPYHRGGLHTAVEHVDVDGAEKGTVPGSLRSPSAAIPNPMQVPARADRDALSCRDGCDFSGAIRSILKAIPPRRRRRSRPWLTQHLHHVPLLRDDHGVCADDPL